MFAPWYLEGLPLSLQPTTTARFLRWNDLKEMNTFTNEFYTGHLDYRFDNPSNNQGMQDLGVAVKK